MRLNPCCNRSSTRCPPIKPPAPQTTIRLSFTAFPCVQVNIPPLCLLQCFYLLQPDCSRGVTWHAPVATRRERHRAYLGAVRHGGAFELLTEKSINEHLQPAQDRGAIITIHKGHFRH